MAWITLDYAILLGCCELLLTTSRLRRALKYVRPKQLHLGRTNTCENKRLEHIWCLDLNRTCSNVRGISKHGRASWQKASGYTNRTRAEAAIKRFKQVIGDGRSRPRFHVRSMWNVGGGCARARTGAGRPR